MSAFNFNIGADITSITANNKTIEIKEVKII